MCDSCGCNITPGVIASSSSARTTYTPTGTKPTTGNAPLLDEFAYRSQHEKHAAISVLESLLHKNEHQAAHNRQHFDNHRVLAINLMSSPGSGKTALLEATIEAVGDQYRVAVIEGDLETENDANRIRQKGVPAVQITTGSACHLDAHMIHDALHELDLAALDIVFIENVGNLVCPASFDLGHHVNAVLLSTTEGDDKPIKYPVMFRAADALLLTKTDLLPVLSDFNPRQAEHYFRRLSNSAPVLSVATRGQLDIDAWLEWLALQFSLNQQRLAAVTARDTTATTSRSKPASHAPAQLHHE